MILMPVPSAVVTVSVDAFVENLVRFPANATERDRDDLAALYAELQLATADHEAIRNCIREIEEDCYERTATL